MKKPRADSLECRLLAAGKKLAVAALDRWLFEEGVSLAECVSRLQSEFGSKSSIGAVHNFFHARRAERAITRIKSSRELAEMVNALGNQAELDNASLALAAQLTLDLASAPGTDMDTLEKLLKIALKKRDQDLDLRKVKLLEQKAAAFDRAQKILDDSKNSGGLTPETLAKIERELKLL